jgi:hypothetical protein
MNAAERLFYEDIREKRKSGSGAFHMRGKGVKHGISGVKLGEYDSLTPWKKKKYLVENSSEVRSYNMYSTLCSLEELERHPEERQKEILLKWREVHKVNDIVEALQVRNKSQYYELLYKRGVIERPSSSKEPKGSRPGPAPGGKLKPDANPEDILPWNDLKLLPKEEQLQWLDDYNENYNLHSVADIWGKQVSQVYNLRYTLRKSLEKKAADASEGSEKVTRKSVAIAAAPPEEKEVITIDEPKLEKVKEETPKQLAFEPEPEQNEFYLKKALHDTIKQQQEEVRLLNQTRQELEQLAIVVKQQAAIITELRDKPAAPAAQPAPAAAAAPNNDNAFTIRYDDKKEGFLLHTDISRLLAMLQKNPDTFQAEVIIKRMEE